MEGRKENRWRVERRIDGGYKGESMEGIKENRWRVERRIDGRVGRGAGAPGSRGAEKERPRRGRGAEQKIGGADFSQNWPTHGLEP